MRVIKCNFKSLLPNPLQQERGAVLMLPGLKIRLKETVI